MGTNFYESFLIEKDYNPIMDVKKLSSEFIYYIEKSNNHMNFANKIKITQLDQLDKIFNIYKEMYFSGNLTVAGIYNKFISILSN